MESSADGAIASRNRLYHLLLVSWIEQVGYR
jgi:hypothetical protein